MNDAIERIWRRVLLMIGRGRVTASEDAGAVQKLQVQLGAEEVKDNTPRLGEYGFASRPPAGSDAIVLFIAGERSNGVVIATGNQQHRMLNLQEGEASLHDDKGQYVYLTASGIVINGGGLPVTVMNAPSVTLDTPVVHLTGSLQVDGDITAGGDVADQGGTKTMAGMRADYNAHKHGTSPLTDHPM